MRDRWERSRRGRRFFHIAENNFTFFEADVVNLCLSTIWIKCQLGLMPFSTRDAKSVAATMGHSDVVVNMIGKHYLTKHIVPTRKANGKINRINYDFEEVHVTIPRLLARQARESGVSVFIHISGKDRIIRHQILHTFLEISENQVTVRRQFIDSGLHNCTCIAERNVYSVPYISWVKWIHCKLSISFRYYTMWSIRCPHRTAQYFHN